MRVWPLFGHLALYLAVATGGRQSAICSFCGWGYFPLAAPDIGAAQLLWGRSL